MGFVGWFESYFVYFFFFFSGLGPVCISWRLSCRFQFDWVKNQVNLAMGCTSLPAHPFDRTLAERPRWGCCQDKLLLLPDRLHDSRNRALLTYISTFPGFLNWYRHMGKTVEPTEQAADTLRQKIPTIFLKNHRAISATNPTGISISSWKEEKSAQTRQ